jgi:hypothetical protein
MITPWSLDVVTKLSSYPYFNKRMIGIAALAAPQGGEGKCSGASLSGRGLIPKN